MKRLVRILFICGGLVLISTIIFIGVTHWKTDWKSETSVGGSFDSNSFPTKQDVADEEADSEYKLAYSIHTPKDMVVVDHLSIRQGKVHVKICLDDEILYDQELSEGDHMIETEELPKIMGNVTVQMQEDADTQGNYSIQVRTREARLQRLLGQGR